MVDRSRLSPALLFPGEELATRWDRHGSTPTRHSSRTRRGCSAAIRLWPISDPRDPAATPAYVRFRPKADSNVQRIDHQPKCRRRLSPTGVVQVVSGERRAPTRQYPNQFTRVDVWRELVFGKEGDA